MKPSAPVPASSTPPAGGSGTAGDDGVNVTVSLNSPTANAGKPGNDAPAGAAAALNSVEYAPAWTLKFQV